jgi:hypothetical protein
MTNFRKYGDEFRHLWYVMKSEHLPRFKHGSFDPREKENYPHLLRNLWTETFRAMPRTISGLALVWFVYWLLFG